MSVARGIVCLLFSFERMAWTPLNIPDIFGALSNPWPLHNWKSMPNSSRTCFITSAISTPFFLSQWTSFMKLSVISHFAKTCKTYRKTKTSCSLCDESGVPCVCGLLSCCCCDPRRRCHSAESGLFQGSGEYVVVTHAFTYLDNINVPEDHNLPGVPRNRRRNPHRSEPDRLDLGAAAINDS